MDNPITRRSWSPVVVGAAIGVLSWFAFWSADRPLGITTSFEHTAALTAKAAMPEVEHTHDYYHAKQNAGKPPKIGWEWMLVIGVFVGSVLSSWLSGDRTRLKVPDLWKHRFGKSVAKRFAAAFFGGALMMLGARLAQGCTSGHGISGALQLAISSWVFVAVFFAVGIATAFLMFGKERYERV
jgi:uncharacterized membrane protein YedE/YeeE